MRIISGIRRGMNLKAPEGTDTRPTTDRVKESVFNIIQPYMPCKNVLDLFAGSGALGIEAISRHCEKCFFIEHNRNAFNIIKENLNSAKFSDNAELVFSDSTAFLDSASVQFDIIFMDPPYNKGFIKPCLDKIFKRNLLSNNGIIVIETEKNGESAENSNFSTRRVATYGNTIITVLSRGGN